MTSAIVTGASGFVGVHLVNELISSGIKVTALCRENSKNIGRIHPKCDIVCSMSELPAADVFYHLAWEGASGSGRSDAVLQAENAILTLDALKAAHAHGCGRFIALGTIYERLSGQIKDLGIFGGSDFYILSKEYSHMIASKLAYKLGMEFIWCEICHPIGRYIKSNQMMAAFIKALLSNESPSFGSAQTPYDIVAVEDVALGLRLLGSEKALDKREYYIGSGKPRILKEWLLEARDAIKSDFPIGFGERPDDGLLFDMDWFDISAITEDTGYVPKTDIGKAVINTAKWMEENI